MKRLALLMVYGLSQPVFSAPSVDYTCEFTTGETSLKFTVPYSNDFTPISKKQDGFEVIIENSSCPSVTIIHELSNDAATWYGREYDLSSGQTAHVMHLSLVKGGTLASLQCWTKS